VPQITLLVTNLFSLICLTPIIYLSLPWLMALRHTHDFGTTNLLPFYLLIMFFMFLVLFLTYYPLVVSLNLLIVLFLLPKILFVYKTKQLIGTGCESHDPYHLRTYAHVDTVMNFASLLNSKLGHPSFVKIQHLVPSYLVCPTSHAFRETNSKFFSCSVFTTCFVPFCLSSL